MFRKVLTVLDKPAHRALWLNRPPLAVTTKVEQMRGKVVALELAGGKQEKGTSGATKEKARKRRELEEGALTMGGCLVVCCQDSGDEATGLPFRLTPSDWHALRDEQLLAKAKAMRDAAFGITEDAAKAPAAANYGITPETVAELDALILAFSGVITAPDTVTTERKAITKSLAAMFAEVEALITDIAALIRRYRKLTGGAAFEAEFRAARTINDRGHGSGPNAPEAPTGFTLMPGAAGSKQITFSAIMPATATALVLFSQSATDAEPVLVSTFEDAATQNTITFASNTSGDVLAFTLHAQNAGGMGPAAGPVDGTIP